MLAKIYTVPTDRLEIERDKFSTESAVLFFNKYEKLTLDSHIKKLLELHRNKIEHRANRLRLFSERCCGSNVTPLFITCVPHSIDYIITLCKLKSYILH